MSAVETRRATDLVLDIRHVSVDYGGGPQAVHAVNDVSLSLRRGEILGLAGESGSGKSTLAHAITQLLRPPAGVVAGEILYYPGQRKAAAHHEDRDGEPVELLSLPPAELRRLRWRELAIVFQSAMNALNPVLNVATQITDVLAVHSPELSPHARRDRAIELLRTVGIAPDRLRSFPHELSGGMRQRVMIAIALALNPEVILMDEPTTALDVVVQREILMEIMELREQFGFSVIFITHDLSLLLEMSDTIAIMYAGRVVEIGTAAQVYHQPRHPYTYGLLHSFPSLHGPKATLHGIPGSPPDLRAMPAGCAFHPRCGYAFEACPRTLPSLIMPDSAAPEQRAACLLYDRKVHPHELPAALRPVAPLPGGNEGGAL
ncbi:MAG TPA: ABC transporter ATP-binding protein [Ktedonobacterales bacterium]|jgi:peptide/nickel transport system ATP-binding protein|nr:ABC transporter ATP-binding protein [Ktedonobacterales bacterium]